MSVDPYNPRARYEKWRKSVEKTGILDVSEYDSKIILQYLDDMNYGINISKVSSKGGRSAGRLNAIREKIRFFSHKFHEVYNLDKLTDVTEIQLIKMISMMRNGEILTKSGKKFISAGDYVKTFKAFWHWWQKVNRKKGIEILDITEDLDSKSDKPKWVYLDDEQVKKLCNFARYDYKVLMMFLFDTGIRAPTEVMNIKVSDFYNDFKEVQIREDVSKTFGRRIKLMISSELIKNYVKDNKFKEEDYLFQLSPASVNKYIKRLAERLFGHEKSPAGERYSNLTMYDFRHCSCCYWLPRYKSESALKYRFGWKKSDKIHYYSEMLGMKDTITEEDLLVDVTKTELEKRLTKAEREAEFLREDNEHMKKQMREILEMIMMEKSQLEART